MFMFWGRIHEVTRGAGRRRRGYSVLLITVLSLCLLLPGPTPAAAAGDVNSAFTSQWGRLLCLAPALLATAFMNLIAPGPRLLDGEFYGGAYLGASFCSAQ